MSCKGKTYNFVRKCNIYKHSSSRNKQDITQFKALLDGMPLHNSLQS